MVFAVDKHGKEGLLTTLDAFLVLDCQAIALNETNNLKAVEIILFMY